MFNSSFGPAQRPRSAVMGKAQELMERLRQQREEAGALAELWGTILPEFEVPNVRQFLTGWLRPYGFDTVVKGIETAAQHYHAQQQKIAELHESGELTPEKQQALEWGQTDVVRYASGVMKQTKLRQEQP